MPPFMPVRVLVSFCLSQWTTLGRFGQERVLPVAADRTRRVLVARCSGRIVGTVQLNLAMPPNQNIART